MMLFRSRGLLVFYTLFSAWISDAAATNDTLYFRTDSTVNVRMYFVVQKLLINSGHAPKTTYVNQVPVLDSSDAASFFEFKYSISYSPLLSGQVNKVAVLREGKEHRFAPVNPAGHTPFWFTLAEAKQALPDSDFVYLNDYVVNGHTHVLHRVVKYVAENSRFDNSFCHNPTGITMQIVNNLVSGGIEAFEFSFDDSPMCIPNLNYPFGGYGGIYSRKLQIKEIRDLIYWQDTGTAEYHNRRQGFWVYERAIQDSFYMFVFHAEVFGTKVVTDLSSLEALGPMRKNVNANGEESFYSPFLVHYRQLYGCLTPLQWQIVDHAVNDDFSSDVVWRLSESIYWIYPDLDSSMLRIMNKMKSAVLTRNLAAYHDPEFRIRESNARADSVFSNAGDIVAINVVRYWYRTDSKSYANRNYVLAVGPVVRDKSGNHQTLCYWRYDITLLRAIGERDYESIGKFINQNTIYGDAIMQVDGSVLSQPKVGVYHVPINLLDCYENGDTINLRYMVLHGPGIKPGEKEIYIVATSESRLIPKVTSDVLLPVFVGTFQPMSAYYSIVQDTKVENYVGTLPIPYGFGYMDTSGVMIIQPQFRTAALFSESRARVSNYVYTSDPNNSNYKYGYIDSTGTLIGEYKYDEARDFHEGRAAVCIKVPRKLKWGFVDPQMNEVVPCQYFEVRDYRNGFAAVRDSAGWFFIDKNGKPLTSGRYIHIHDFEGTTAVVTEGKKHERKMGIIDAKGILIVPVEYDTIGPLSEGLRMVKQDSLYGFMNEKGKTKLEMKYDGANSFLNGYASVSINHQWGYIDKKGKMVLNFKYDWAGFYSEGLFAVRQNHKWGYVDRRDTIVIPLQFDSVGTITAGRFACRDGSAGRFGWAIWNVERGMVFNSYVYAQPMINDDGSVMIAGGTMMELYDTSGRIIGRRYGSEEPFRNLSANYYQVYAYSSMICIDRTGRSYIMPN